MAQTLEAFHLSVGSGYRFSILHRADRAAGPYRGTVLHAPAFAEEMNKARRMISLGARALAQSGYDVLLVDLAGTGDSSGEFGDASWDAWLEDLDAARTWLRARGDGPTWLWGLRTGCLLAQALHSKYDDQAGLLYWQPVASGKQFLQQFLRMKLVGQLAVDGARSGSVRALRESLAGGAPLEVGGYQISPALADQLDRAELAVPTRGTRVSWFEITSSEPATLGPVAQDRIALHQERGCIVTAESLLGDPFWQTQELSECPSLIERTIATLAH